MAALATPANLAGSVRRRPAVVLAWWLVACFALSALSLLIARQNTYDPTAWLIWGREIVHNKLATTYGPSWKPLPTAVAIPAGLLSLGAQAQIWLVFARAGGLMAVVLGFRLARRLGGTVAGVIAAVAIVLAVSFISHTFRGDSEGILAALALAAVEAHADDRRRLALLFLGGMALDRPEMLLAFGLYGLWMVWEAPRTDRVRGLAWVVAGGLFIVAAWVVPEEFGSGEILRAASRALTPVAGSPGQASFPFLATFTNAARVIMWPLYVGGIFVVGHDLLVWRRTRQASLVLVAALLATMVMVLVAAMAQGGFTGNIRYLTAASTLTAVIGAVGVVDLGRFVRDHAPRWGVWVAAILTVAACAPTLVVSVHSFTKEWSDAMRETRLYDDLPRAIAAAGGREAVLRCGLPFTGPFDTQALARDLGVHEKQVAIKPDRPGAPAGMVFQRAGGRLPTSRPTKIAQTKRWAVTARCG